MPRIVAVNGADQKNASALIYLQLEILPSDAPLNPLEGHWWLAYDEDQPIGFAALLPSVRWGDCGYLARAGVLTSHRGKGLQRRMLAARERKARALGWKWLITDTAHWNVASANSLIARGYRVFKPSEPWGWDTATYWRKSIK